MADGPAALLLLAIALAVAAIPVDAAFEPLASCFEGEGGHYNFHNGIIFGNFHTEQAAYSPGEEVEIDYSITGNQLAPIIDSFVRVQVLFEDAVQGEQLADEFFPGGVAGKPLKDVNLRYGDRVDKEIRWRVPAGARPGNYTIKAYIISGDAFNLAGLSFVPYGPPGVPGIDASFAVKNADTSAISFDKLVTTFNGKPYLFSTFVPIIGPDDKISVTTQLANHGPAKTAVVAMEIYEWDDVSGKPIDKYSTIASVELPAGGKKALDFSVPALGPNAYELRMAATSSAENAVLKMRFAVAGQKPRLIYAGLDGFPMLAGSQYQAFFCASNAAESTSFAAGKVRLTFTDRDGKTVFQETSGLLDIPPQPSGMAAAFIPAAQITKGTLTAEILDGNDAVLDYVELPYDYSLFPAKDAQLRLTMGQDSYVIGAKAGYAVDLTDPAGLPLSGDLLIELRAPDGRAVQVDEQRMEDHFESMLDLAKAPSPGTYTLVVRERSKDLMAQQQFSVTAAAATDTNLLAIASAALLALAAIGLLLRGRKR
ncbi:MAG: hypothetical protein HY519_01785 [Candidatus Aenigmarchaeota archaeon]|nr:hypothetical protein [Candidatus Aenigmarchaeota archaeon]